MVGLAGNSFHPVAYVVHTPRLTALLLTGKTQTHPLSVGRSACLSRQNLVELPTNRAAELIPQLKVNGSLIVIILVHSFNFQFKSSW